MDDAKCIVVTHVYVLHGPGCNLGEW